MRHPTQASTPLLPQLAHALSPLLWLVQAAALARGITHLQAGMPWHALLAPAAWVVLAAVAQAWLNAWSERRLFDAARAQLSLWRQQVAHTLAARSPLDRHRPHAGTAASVLAEQAESILPWLTRYSSAQWRVVIVPPLLLLPVAWFSWAAAAVLLLAAPLIPLFMAIVGWRAQQASEQQWVQLGQMNAYLLDRLRGLPTLRALGSVDSSARRLRDSVEDLRQRTMRVLRIAFLSSAVLELFAALGVAMVAAYIGFHLLGHLNFGTWGQHLSLGQGLFVLLLAPAFFEPLRDLAAAWHDRAAGLAAMDALKQLSADGLPLPDAAPHHQTRLAATPSSAGPPSVHLQDLELAFDTHPPVLQNFHLQVAPGEHVAVVGSSGSGKTVLLALLAGLLAPDAGRIEIGGMPMTATTAASLRARMAWMGQHPHVFHGPLPRNVTLGRDGISAAQLQQAIEQAHLGALLQSRPGIWLGEGGIGLSGGESARLALARLAVTPHADLLLLDEPTAHLDRDTAALVMDTIVQLAQGRTLIVATHDPALIARMDRAVQISASATQAMPAGVAA